MPTKFDAPPTLQLQNTPQQQTNLTQRLIMSAHMQQAIHLLQLPLLELESFIEEQVVQNPLLEIEGNNEETPEEFEGNAKNQDPQSEDEEHEVTISDQDLSILSRLDDDWRNHFAESESVPMKNTSEDDKLHSYIEQSICFEPSLHDQLRFEAHQTFENPHELEIADVIIGYIDQFGFMKTSIKEISILHQFPEEEINKALKVIQTFEPYGVGASTIQESLLIQLHCLKKEKTLAYEIIQHHYDELLHNQIPLIQKSLKCTYEEIEEAIQKDIAKLDLHPGTHFSSQPTRVMVPDVTLRQENEELVVEVERDFTPTLRLNHRYLKMLEDPSISAETKSFVKRHLFSARWLVRNLQQRYSTIERIAQSLAKRQYTFFTNPNGQLVPLTMKTVADDLNVHESTVARTVSNKYLFCPRGLFPLRSFFTNKYISQEGEDLSSTTVKEAIMDLLNKEDKSHPLSDEKISLLLKNSGINCARRTVAKYRFVLEIGNAQQRKKFK